MVHLDRTRADNGRFDTSEVRKVDDEPNTVSSRLIAFPKDHYKRPPNIAAGFRSLDISCDGPIRANLIADNITKQTFRIAIESWGDAILHSAGATWIEHKATARQCIFGQFDTQDGTQAPAKSATAPHAGFTKKQAVQTVPVPKKYAKAFEFPRAFKEPPEVVCWLNRLDLSSGPGFNYKVRAYEGEVDRKGFVAHLNTWDDGELNGAAMCWIAFPKRKRYVDSGRISTNDVRKRTQPRERTTARVKFRQRFEVVPTVLASLNMIDAAGCADLRVNLVISDVDKDGFRWTLETWDDSTLYAAAASWVALGFPY